jgi:hypothetical protein
MKATAYSAMRGLSVIIFLSFFSTTLNAQNNGVVIKERVELTSLGTNSILSNYGIGWDSIPYIQGATLTIRIIGFTYQEIRGSVRSLNNLIGGFNPYTGTTTDNIQYIPAGTNPDDGDGGVWPEVKYETTAPLTFYYGNLYFKDSIGSDSFPYTGKVEVEYGNECVYQVIFDETGSYPGTPWLGSSGMIYLNFTGYPKVQCPPGYYLNIQGTYDMQYGETTYIFTETLDGCGYHVNEPPESYFKYELVGDTLSGTLRDLTTGRTGAVLDSVGNSVIEFDVRGKEPKESETITLKVSAVNGTIDPATGTINVYPPEVRAIPGKSELTYGDTTSLTIEVRLPGGNWMPMPYDWYGTYTIMQADTFGFLYNTDSTVIGSSIRNKDPKINFAVNPETEPDSVEVLIQLFASEPCYNCGVGKIMPSDTMNLGSRQQPLKTSTLLKQRIQDNILTNHQSPMLKQQLTNNISKKSVSSTASPIRVNNNWHYGLARLMVKKKPLCPVVEMSKKNIYPGDTVLLSFVYGSNGSPVPADKSLDVSILGGTGGENGTLLVNGSTGTNFTGVTQPIRYIAPANISGNSLVVSIAAAESESSGGGGPAASIHQKDSLKLSLKKNSTMSSRILKVLQAQGTLAVCPIGNVTVENDCGNPPCGDPPMVNVLPPRDVSNLIPTPQKACQDPVELGWTTPRVGGDKDLFPNNTLNNLFSVQVCANRFSKQWEFRLTTIGFLYQTGICESHLIGKTDIGDGMGPNVNAGNYCDILKWLKKINPITNQPYPGNYYSRNIIQLHEGFHLEKLYKLFRNNYFQAFINLFYSSNIPITDCSESAQSVIDRNKNMLEEEFDKLTEVFVKTEIDNEESDVQKATKIYFKGLKENIEKRAVDEKWPKCQ